MAPAAPRALIVDDDKLVRMLVARTLSAERIVCDQADDGEAAVRRFEDERYDIVVTDLVMPNRHGHSLCQSLLVHPHRPVLVVMTGLAEPRITQDLKARGVDAIYQKPIDFPTFGKQVRALFDARFTNTGNSAERPVENTESPDAAKPTRKSVIAILLSSANRAQQLARELDRESVQVFVPKTTDALRHF